MHYWLKIKASQKNAFQNKTSTPLRQQRHVHKTLPCTLWCPRTSTCLSYWIQAPTHYRITVTWYSTRCYPQCFSCRTATPWKLRVKANTWVILSYLVMSEGRASLAELTLVLASYPGVSLPTTPSPLQFRLDVLMFFLVPSLLCAHFSLAPSSLRSSTQGNGLQFSHF